MGLGLVLVLDNFGLWEARHLVRYWPLLLIGLGLHRVYDSVRRRKPMAGHVMVVLGVFLLLGNLGLITPRQGMALFLLIGGAALALRAARGYRGPATLGGTDYLAASDTFGGGQASALMGACEIDLRDARIEGQAVLDLFAFWGGIEIRVPPDWMVEGRGIAVLGAFEDKSRRPDDGSPKLIVTGLVIMGGVEVKN
jgi:hypothetical protein